MFIYTVAVQASKPSSDSDDSNSDTNQLSESHDDEDAGPMPGVDNPAVAHSPELEAIVPAGRVHGGGNGLELLGAGRAAGHVSGLVQVMGEWVGELLRAVLLAVEIEEDAVMVVE